MGDGAVPERVGVGVVGAGNIAGPYLRDLCRYPEVEVRWVAARHPERAAALAAEHAVPRSGTVAEVLADPRVAVLVNLTAHASHVEVTRRALLAGRHVHSEKPLATTSREAWELVDLAERRGLRLSCAPANTLGEAARTVVEVVRRGDLGRVGLVYAEANWGRIESWHPSPAGFYAVGPLWDVGVYPLTLAVALFGPVRGVSAYGTVLRPHRTSATGVPFDVTADDLTVAVLELANGVRMRLTTNFYVPPGSTAQRGVEIHGDAASLLLSDWQRFDAEVELVPPTGPRTAVPPVAAPFPGIEWGRAVRELVAALRERRPHPTPARTAAHVVDVLEAITSSARAGRPVALPERPGPS